MGARQKGDELKGEEEQRCLSFAFQYRFPSCHCDNDATIVVPPYTMYYLPVRSCSCQRGWRPCKPVAASTHPLQKPYFRMARTISVNFFLFLLFLLFFFFFFLTKTVRRTLLGVECNTCAFRILPIINIIRIVFSTSVSKHTYVRTS